MTCKSFLAPLMVFLISSVIYAQSFQSTLYRSNTYEYEYKALAIQETGLWLGVGLRPKGQLGGPQQYQLWKLDLQGKKLSEVDLASFSTPERATDRYTEIYDIAAVPNEDLAALVRSESGQLALIVLKGSNSGLSINRVLKTKHRDLFIDKLLTTPDGDLLAVGRAGDEGLLLKMHATGDIVFETVVHDKDLTVISDALELEGQYIALGAHLESGETSMWLGKLNPKGEVLAKATFAGREGGITHSDRDHSIVVVLSTPTATAWDVSVRAFGENLGPLWKAQLFSGTKTMVPFRIVPAPSEGFLVAGATTKNVLWTAQIDRAGQVQWTREHPEENAVWQMVWNQGLAATSKEWVIPFTELVVGKEMEQRQVIRLLRLAKK